MVYQIRKFVDSTNFSNALKVTIASAIPVLVFARLHHFPIGFTIALGALLTFPSDISSNLKHKINGIMAAMLIVSGSAFIISLAYPYPWLLYPVLTALIFLLAMISVYGQRATSISFSGLLSISLVFSKIYEGGALYQHCGLLLVGGLFYLLISLIFYYIRPYRYLEIQIAQCILLTSKYLKLRGDLWSVDADRADILEKQLHLQVELNDIHQNLREVLIGNRSKSGVSNQNRKMLIVFVSLVEVLELALSTSFDHAKLRAKFSAHPRVLATYQNLAYNLAATLRQLSQSVESKKSYVSKHNLFKDLNALEQVIKEYENDLGKDAASEGVFMLTTMLEYAERQVERIMVVERAFTLAINTIDFAGRDKDLEKFLTPQYYPLSTLLENFSITSNIFRHSLRLTVTILIGFIVGKLLPFQNVYWILLTIVVIMRPGYGLTKQRSYHRIIGTVVGGLIAFGFLMVVHNTIIIGALATIAMILGFSFSQIDYKIGATFVTIYVIFINGILVPNIGDVVQYRILDTLVGAFLAVVANYFFWPTWEFLNVPVHLQKSIEANRNYLKEISEFYNKKGEVPTSYRLARKNAFIEIGNLMASFQRMVQEPKSKQKQLPMVYKLVELNHTLLSSSASLGTYIQSHKTSKASEAFNVVVDTVIKNLDGAISILKHEKIEPEQITAKEVLASRFIELKNIRAKELKEGIPIDEAAFQLKMQEAQLVIEQLIWLTRLSENILKEVSNIDVKLVD